MLSQPPPTTLLFLCLCSDATTARGGGGGDDGAQLRTVDGGAEVVRGVENWKPPPARAHKGQVVETVTTV